MDIFIVIILMIFLFFGFILFLVDALVYIYSICTGTEVSFEDKVLLKFLAVCCVFIYFLLPTSNTSDTNKDIPKTNKTVAATEKTTIMEEKPSTTEKHITTDKPATTEEKPPVKETINQYNALEKIFIRLNSKTRENDFKAMVADNALSHSVKNDGDGVMKYIVAFDETVTLPKKEKKGDYIEVYFDKNGVIKTGEYVKHGTDVSAFYYNYGTWWDLKSGPENQYSGYYNIKDPGKGKGMKITYSNGTSVKTDLYPCASAEEALSKI